MLKVKRIVACGNETFEDKINDFIADKEVIDIKYQAGVVYDQFDRRGNGAPMSVRSFDRALIIYKEKENA